METEKERQHELEEADDDRERRRFVLPEISVLNEPEEVESALPTPLSPLMEGRFVFCVCPEMSLV